MLVVTRAVERRLPIIVPRTGCVQPRR
jgi:hypothetical protein